MSPRELEQFDFRAVSLRGCCFDGLKLRNLDFSRADIRGASFKDTQIEGSSFRETMCGVSPTWERITNFLSCLSLILVGIILSYSFTLILINILIPIEPFSRLEGYHRHVVFAIFIFALIWLGCSCTYLIKGKPGSLVLLLSIVFILAFFLIVFSPSSTIIVVLALNIVGAVAANISFILIRVAYYLDYLKFKSSSTSQTQKNHYKLKRLANTICICCGAMIGTLASILPDHPEAYEAVGYSTLALFIISPVIFSLVSYFYLSKNLTSLVKSSLIDPIQSTLPLQNDFLLDLSKAIHSLITTDFSHVRIADSDFTGATLGFSRFRNARLIRSEFKDADLKAVDFSGMVIERTLSNAASYQVGSNFGVINFGPNSTVSRLDSRSVDVADQDINVTTTTHLHDVSVIVDASSVGSIDVVSDNLWEIVAEELATLLRKLKKRQWQFKEAKIAGKSGYSEVRSLSEELVGILEEIRTIEVDSTGDMIPVEIDFISSFFAQAGAEIANREANGFTISDINGRLNAYVPFRVMVGGQSLADQKFDELLQPAYNKTTVGSNVSQLAFWVFYGQLSEASRNKIIQLRTHDNRCVIPVAYDLIATTLKSGGSATGRLADIYNQYLPGANLFEDSSSIAHAADFYGRFSLVSQLRQALIKQVANLSRQQSIALLGLRKSGKTSVLRQLQTEFAISDIPVLRIDLSQYLGQSQWGHSLFREIIEGLNEWVNSPIKTRQTSVQPVDTAVFQQKQPAPEVTSAFREALLQSLRILHEQGWQLPIILLLDEVEAVMPQKTDPDLARYLEFNAVFGSFRAIAQEIGQLALVLADVHPDFNRANVWSRSGVDKNPVYQYFKEVYLEPFALSDIHIMLKDLGGLMGVRFDPAVIEAIHQQSGGHPFIARRIAGFLYQKAREESWLDEEGRLSVSPQTAAGYLENILEEFEPLDGYFEANIWADLQMRQEDTAMAVLKILAINDHSSGISRTAILQKLSERFSDGQHSSKALSLLMNLGLVKQVRTEGGDRHYKISIGLLAEWILTICQQDEINGWRLD